MSLYVGRCKECRNIVAAHVADPGPYLKEAIADMVIGALDVQLEDVETVFVTGCAPGCSGKDGKRGTQ